MLILKIHHQEIIQKNIKEGDVIKIDYLSKADEIKVTVTTLKSSKPKNSKDKEEKS